MKTLTFAETLHPEDAQDHLGLQGDERGWRVVYNETRNNDYPTAVARRVDDENSDDSEDDVEQGQRKDSNGSQELPLVVLQPNLDVDVPDGTDDSNHVNETQQSDTPRTPSGKGCFFLEGLVGYSFALAAVSCAFGMELGAAIVYTIAAGFYYITTFDEIGIFFKALFLLIVQLFVIIDAIILTLSVMVTELIGALSCLTTLFMVVSCHQARDWPLYIRRMCHATRWAFRGFHKRWALERTFPVDVFDRVTSRNTDQTASDKSDEEAAAPSQSFAQIEQPPTSIDAENIVVVDHVGYEDAKK